MLFAHGYFLKLTTKNQSTMAKGKQFKAPDIIHQIIFEALFEACPAHCIIINSEHS